MSLLRLFALLAGLLASGAAMAQAWPARPITMLIPFPAGTGADIIARVLGAQMAELLGQPVIAETRSGASGNIAMEATSKAAPDGYTLVMASTSYSINLYTMKGTAPLTAFTPVALVGKLPQILMVSPQLAVRDLKGLITLLKTKNGQYNAGTGGPTGTSFFLSETLKKAAAVDLEVVAYKGTAEAVSDLLEGRLHILFAAMPVGLPLSKAGKVQIVGTTGTQRNPLTPTVATFTEAGFPMLDVPSWYAILGPAGMPGTITSRLNQAANKALASKESAQQLSAIGVDVSPGSPADATNFLKQDSAMWGKMARDAGVKIP